MPHVHTEFFIADNARARRVRRSASGHDFQTVQELQAGPAAPTRPQGVVFESGGGRYNIEERQSAVDRRRYRFADDIARLINDQVARGEAERICLVAPSRTLAALRRRLTPDAEARIAHTLAKDLTKTPDHELGAWLSSLELD